MAMLKINPVGFVAGGGMFRTVLTGVAAVAVAWGVLIAPVSPVRADALVIASKAGGLRAGSVLDDAHVLDLEAGQSVTLLLVDGRTRAIVGPFSEPIASFSKGRPSDETFWQTVVSSLPRPTARKRAARRKTAEAPARRYGSGRPETHRYAKAPAPPRSVAPAGAVERLPAGMSFSWKQVPIDAEGDYCIQKGDGLVLARVSAAAAQPATVIDVRAGARAQVIFTAGNATTAWPAAIAVKTGPYALQLPQETPRQIRLRVIDPLPQADETLRLLHSQRCQSQIEAWLRGVATANR